MGGFYRHGPTLTYVTDPTLDEREQQRVLGEFIRCAPDQMLRVAFRLPDAPDGQVRALLEWYLSAAEEVAEDEEARENLLPPVVHGRHSIAEEYREVGLWMPARSIGTSPTADMYSVHNLDEARRAVKAGAGEVIYGHVFPSGSHPGEPGRGVEALKRVAENVRTDVNTPIVTAIGGIDEHTVGEIGRARVFNVACIRAISRSPDIARTLGAIRNGWVTALIDEDLNDPNPLAFDRMWGIWHRWAADGRM